MGIRTLISRPAPGVTPRVRVRGGLRAVLPPTPAVAVTASTMRIPTAPSTTLTVDT
ncbi:hypothetical protein ACIGAN_21470 [Streptomyces sp. NPDC085931]|uniref:hypothetical protein n=1 Tax=Streptomyces sp. NPDC085931 TaxID=3365740 RepID=UPI0037D43D17